MVYQNMIKDANEKLISKCNELIIKRSKTNIACEFAYMVYTTMLKNINHDDKEEVSNIVSMGVALAKQFNVDYNSLIDRSKLIESAIKESNILIHEYASLGLEDMVKSVNAVKEAYMKYMDLVKNTIELYENKYLKDINFEAIGGIK